MKKKLFLALLTTLLILLAASSAMAAENCTYCNEGTYEATTSTVYRCSFKCNKCGSTGGRAHIHSDGTCSICGQHTPCKYDESPTSNGDGTHSKKCTDPNCPWPQPDAEPCSGGTATCTSGPKCVDCGGEYREPLGHAWGNWQSSNGQHVRTCLRDTSHQESGTCSGGTATCSQLAECEVCHALYGNYSTTHGEFSDWEGFNNDQHYRYCTSCGLNHEYADHTGGTATCSQQAVCEVCHALYGEVSTTNHVKFSDWAGCGETQHYRFCTACGGYAEYADHSGGTATCTQPAECEVCGSQYGDISSTNHGEFSDWEGFNNDQHYRYCTSCGLNHEYADHTGGTATCTEYAVCEVCNSPYGVVSDTNHGEFSNWSKYDETQHIRACVDCGQNQEFGNHTGGTANCVLPAVCEVCNFQYGDIAPTNHGEFSEWMSYDDTQHYRFCIECGKNYEYADHTGGEATCVSGAICTVCNRPYGDIASEHGPYSDWTNAGTRHYRMCQTCGQPEYGDHTGGTAACVTYAKCEVCDTEYGELAPDNHSWGKWQSNANGTHTRVCQNDASHTETADCSGGTATCTARAVCKDCDTAYGASLGGHSWGKWNSNNDGTHTRVCQNDASHTETADCSGGTATCTARATCKDCGGRHGAALGHIPGAAADCISDQVCIRKGCGAVLAQKLGHDYTAVVTKPTCTAKGYTTYTCSRCGDSYEADETPARGHWYDPWYPNQDGTHSAECRRSGCGHVGTAECTLYEVTAKDGGAEVILTVCPVCGDHEKALFTAVDGAAIENVHAHEPLPYGEQILRELDAPFDGVLYAFTAAHESAGYVVPFSGKVSVSLPLDAEEYAGFKLVRVDVIPATETAARTEVWTELAFTLENAVLTFETDVAGLFLLVPAE